MRMQYDVCIKGECAVVATINIDAYGNWCNDIQKRMVELFKDMDLEIR